MVDFCITGINGILEVSHYVFEDNSRVFSGILQNVQAGLRISFPCMIQGKFYVPPVSYGFFVVVQKILHPVDDTSGEFKIAKPGKRRNALAVYGGVRFESFKHFEDIRSHLGAGQTDSSLGVHVTWTCLSVPGFSRIFAIP
jgi:hypothetical protein